MVQKNEISLQVHLKLLYCSFSSYKQAFRIPAPSVLFCYPVCLLFPVASGQLHKKQCKDATDDPVRKTVAGFLFPIHVQNVIADNYIILRMEKKVVYFSLEYRFPTKKPEI